MRKMDIVNHICSCPTKEICAHQAAAFLLIRKIKSSALKTKRPTISNNKFLTQIPQKELVHFVLSRMKNDKDFKTLIFSRFFVQIEGIEHIENFLDKAFPPNKTTILKPSHKEIKLFQQVMEELIDQTKDLVGLDNYVDASSILIPLVKKSFYFKNRFETIPEHFSKSHTFIVEMLNVVHSIIEAPSLKSKNARRIIALLELSYVELEQKQEKSLILGLLNDDANKKQVIHVLKEKGIFPHNKSYLTFLIALRYVCQNPLQDQTDFSRIFMEIYGWHQNGHEYLDVILDIAKNHHLPQRFVENILDIPTALPAQELLKTEVALINIDRLRSFNLFKWIYTNHLDKWQNRRNEVIKTLNKKKDHHTYIKILIHEDRQEDLFVYLNKIREISYYHYYLSHLITFSRENTFDLYCEWTTHYFSQYFGQTALDEFERQMRKVNVVDTKLKNQINTFALKKFGERPSLSS